MKKINDNMGISSCKNEYDKKFELFEIVYYDNRWRIVAILFLSYLLLLV